MGNERKDTIKDMVSSFMEKKYNSFLFSSGSNLFEANTFMQMRIYAEGYQQVFLNDPELNRVPDRVMGTVDIDSLSKKLILENRGEILDTVKYIKPKVSDENKTAIQAEFDSHDKLYRLFDYEAFPTDEHRLQELTKSYQRQSVYNDYDSITSGEDPINKIDRIYVQKKESDKLVKLLLSYSLVENFYNYNEYTEDTDVYIENYSSFLKDKIDHYNDPVLNLQEQSEKMCYTLNTENEVDIISKVLTKEWKVM